jgi:hypothetical protein
MAASSILTLIVSGFGLAIGRHPRSSSSSRSMRFAVASDRLSTVSVSQVEP